MDCSLLGSSVHGILQARILDWLPFSSPRDLPDPGIKSRSPAWQADSVPLCHLGSPSQRSCNDYNYPLPSSFSFKVWSQGESGIQLLPLELSQNSCFSIQFFFPLKVEKKHRGLWRKHHSLCVGPLPPPWPARIPTVPLNVQSATGCSCWITAWAARLLPPACR